MAVNDQLLPFFEEKKKMCLYLVITLPRSLTEPHSFVDPLLCTYYKNPIKSV